MPNIRESLGRIMHVIDSFPKLDRSISYPIIRMRKKESNLLPDCKQCLEFEATGKIFRLLWYSSKYMVKN